MEPDVIRMYSSSPPPMEDGAEEEDDDFGDFGTFSAVPNSISFTEFETPTSFNQTQALTATSPPELLNSRGVIGVNGTHGCSAERPKTNGGALSDRTEIKKVISSSQDCSVEEPSSGELTACNGVSAPVLTNGFEEQGSPSSQSSVHCHVTENSTVDDSAGFADFAAFSEPEGSHRRGAGVGVEVDVCSVGECTVEQEVTFEETVRDINRTGSPSSDTHWQPCIDADFQRDITDAEELAASLCTNNNNLALNGTDAAYSQDSDISPDAVDIETGHSDEKGSGNETETETETSFGRLLSTDALEEYGDMSTTGSAPSPPLQGEPSTPADHSQLAEDDEDEDFGDFGEANSFGAQGFTECNHALEEGQQEQSRPDNSVTELEVENTEENDEEFGDFNAPKLQSGGREGEDADGFTEFPASDSFGNFSSAVIAASAVEDNVGWSAFGEEHQMEGESWATFGTEQSSTERQEEGMYEEDEEEEEEEGRQSRATEEEQETSRTDAQMVSLLGRLQKLFENSFPLKDPVTTSVVQEVTSLKNLLEPPAGAAQLEGEEDTRGSCDTGVRGVWTRLQDVNEAVGLRYQWGGSHCNKALLCCLGIDTRNILFTGQRKQPVIVPMYAASLGMLEPTKEPVKPVSAAEMIAAIAMTMVCPSDTVQQEALPPVQFDWSSSGLTNPLDGSSLLNLDFFGSDDEFTCSSTLPGVDPELYELTTSKLDTNTSSGNRVADAFARLMSTMEKTSTSTRKPRKEENLSEEAEKVISSLPDLSFMQAKVLMFPSTLTPLNSRD